MKRITVKVTDLISKFDAEVITSGVLSDNSANRLIRMKLHRTLSIGIGFVHVIDWRLSVDGMNALYDECDQRTVEVGNHLRNILIERRVSFHEVELSPPNEIKRENGTVYLFDGPDNSISISAYPTAHPEYETNHINVLDQFSPKQALQVNTKTLLLNILTQAGVKVVQEY